MVDCPSLPPPFHVRLEPHREQRLIVPRGELDLASVDRMHERFRDQTGLLDRMSLLEG